MVEYMYPYIPPAVFTMEVKDSDIFITIPNKGSQRVIFTGTELTGEEEKHLQAFRQRVKDAKKTFPEWVDDKDRLVLRFLQGNGFDYDKTLKSLEEHIEWRIKSLPVESEEIEELAKAGIIYFFGRDKRYRPVMHINVKKMVDAKLPNETLSQLAIYLLEFALKNLLVPGKAETMVVVIDMTDVGTISIPMTALKTISQMLQNNYRARLYKQYILNTPFLVKATWAIAKCFLEDFTVAKINILGSDYNALYEQVDKSQLEKRLGGSCDNIEEDFFPPQTPPE